MGFNFWKAIGVGKLVEGPEKGLEAGVQLGSDWFHILIYGGLQRNPAIVNSMIKVSSDFTSEAIDEVTGLVNGKVLKAIFSGGDPMKISRQDLEIAETDITGLLIAARTTQLTPEHILEGMGNIALMGITGQLTGSLSSGLVTDLVAAGTAIVKTV